MLNGSVSIHRSLIFRLIAVVGLVLFTNILVWAYIDIHYQEKHTLKEIVESCDRLGTTIKLGTHYAMMNNSREDINEITKNIGRQEGIENIRIYNKLGQIKFSNQPGEVDTKTSIRANACRICHKNEPPAQEVPLMERTRIFDSPAGFRLLGVISPIYNEPSCSTSCHVHPRDKKVLGALDVVVSLKAADAATLAYKRWITLLAVLSFGAISTIIFSFLYVFVNRPIRKLITWTSHIAHGKYDHLIEPGWKDEIGQLAHAIDSMGRQIGEKQAELNKQRDEYQELFEQVPCYITVQDRDLRLIRHNREFASTFEPHPGAYCFEVYKDRREVCETCPVVQTFEDGQSHCSEESGVDKNGKLASWMCRTSALRDWQGNVVAVMQMSIDATERKVLEEEIRKSEQKYREIFNNIPNPIFVVAKGSLDILDFNDSVTVVYGYAKQDLVGTSFLEMFEEAERRELAREVLGNDSINQVRQKTKDGRTIFVNIRVSHSEYLGREALLVSTIDITKHLLAEQQLIQASKMATLGEMATGIAHELNQPLSVIKTASSFIVKKVGREEAIQPDILRTMAEEIDGQVDRASRIINHLREFGRKSEVQKERVNVNEVLEKALAIFVQQLKLRKIEVVKQLRDVPPIMANANRLEQVFINLLINARDAIEEKCEKLGNKEIERTIFLSSSVSAGKVVVEVRDTGAGIPKSLVERIYEPFFTTKRVGKGTGLGLSISYGIVQDYDGTIEVDAAENEGAGFITRFPVAEATP